MPHRHVQRETSNQKLVFKSKRYPALHSKIDSFGCKKKLLAKVTHERETRRSHKQDIRLYQLHYTKANYERRLGY